MRQPNIVDDIDAAGKHIGEINAEMRRAAGVCRHRPKSSRMTCFSYPVVNPPNPAAHGGACWHDKCRCGAVRMTNVNGIHREIGKWN